MNIKINGKELLELLKNAEKGDRKPKTLYLSESLYGEMKDICGVLPVSTVIEELMREFVRTSPKKSLSKKS
jgi:hypothetical protein